MAFYECIYIVRPDLTTEQVEQVMKRVSDIITANGGQILDTELWGRRQLAYMVKKNTKGFYIFHLVEGGGALVATLEGRLKIDEDIIKYQNISVRKPRRLPTPLAPVAVGAPPTAVSADSSSGDASSGGNGVEPPEGMNEPSESDD